MKGVPMILILLSGNNSSTRSRMWWIWKKLYPNGYRISQNLINFSTQPCLTFTPKVCSKLFFSFSKLNYFWWCVEFHLLTLQGNTLFHLGKPWNTWNGTYFFRSIDFFVKNNLKAHPTSIIMGFPPLYCSYFKT